MGTSIRTVHLQLGRTGDLILLLPCWRKIFEDTGEKPIVIVCREFSSVFNGTSYVQPDVINGHWYANVVFAAQMAKLKYGNFVITQCHGVGHETDQNAYPTFGEAMWSKAGFHGQYGTLPLVFDRRNYEREAKLIDEHNSTKPIVLFNFNGLSSPLPCQNEIWARMRRHQRDFKFISLAGIKARCIYDLLGLYDIAAGLITIDTATLHLAAASKVPMLAYCRGGWSSAIPKPGSKKVEYKDAHIKLEAIDEFLESLRNAKSS